MKPCRTSVAAAALIFMAYPFAVSANDIGPPIPNDGAFCGHLGGETQGKPGFKLGSERVGACSASVKWRCPTVLEIRAGGGSPDTYRVIDVLVTDRDNNTLARAWLHQSDHVGTQHVQVAGPGTPPPKLEVTDCAIFKYEEVGPGWKDSSSQQRADAQAPPTSQAENLFASALAKTPEQLRAESAQLRAQAVPSPSTAEPSGDSSPGLQILGALVGGYVAGRTGNTALLETFTGVATSPTPFGVPPSVAPSAANVGGGNCEQVQSTAAQRARATTWSQSCAQNRQTVSFLRSLTDQVVSACGRDSNHGRMWLAEYRQAEANLESGIRHKICN